MPLRKTEAIVIRGAPLGEADKIITFFSPQFGKIKGVAQGVRRPKSRFGSSLEVLTRLQLVYFAQSKTNLHRISQTDLTEYFPGLRQELSQLTAALYLVDIVYSLTAEEDSNPELYDLLLYTLQLLETGKGSFTLLRIFEIRALTLLGYAPQLGCCVNCHKKLDLTKKTVYNVYKGGLCCFNCARGQGMVSLNLGSINFLKQAVKVELDKIGRLRLSGGQAREVQEVLYRHLCHHLKQEIKSYRFLDRL